MDEIWEFNGDLADILSIGILVFGIAMMLLWNHRGKHGKGETKHDRSLRP